jgi:hypothetical protein
MRRDLTLAGALGLLLLATTPAYARVLVDTGWRGPMVAAGLLAVLVAAAVRRLGGGVVASAAASLTGLVAFTYLTALPDVGMLPDTTSWLAFTAGIEVGLQALRESPAPAASDPFTLLLATATWIVWHLAHELLVRWRTAGAALIPPLVLWSVPLAIPLEVDGVTSRAVVFLAVAALVLLLATDDGREPDEAPRATASGVAVATGALSLAVVAPLLLPGYGSDAWLDLAGPDDPRGYQPIVDVSERLRLPAERDVLQVRAPDRTYLRLAGLDSFDGSTWRLGPPGAGSYRPESSALHPADRPLPPESPAASTEALRVEVEVLDLANIYVPTPYQPVEILGPFRDEMVWSTDGGFLATWAVGESGALEDDPRVGVTQGVEYTVAAERPTPVIADLRAVDHDEGVDPRWTELPRDYPELAEIAEEVYAEGDADSVVDRALALQSWFTEDDRFTYDLDVPALRGDDALQRFVTEDRVGYCEYFATAMAVMLRSTGIPARVAVGFLPGEVSLAADPEAGRDLDEYTVSTSDAHAWVEVLFPGYGWVTFEPTPRSDQTQIVPTADDLAPDENLRERRARELAELGEDDTADTSDVPDTPDVDTPQPTPETGGPETADDPAGGDAGAGTPVWPLVVAAVALAAVAAVALRRREADAHGTAPARVLTAQRHLLQVARRLGVGRAPHETTTEVVRRWRAEGRIESDADRFADLAQAAAFGGEIDDEVAREAEQLVAALEEELRASVPTRDRVVAPVRVPATVTARRARELGDRVVRGVRGER